MIRGNKLLALLLALALCFAFFPAAALAEEEEAVGSIELIEDAAPEEDLSFIAPAPEYDRGRIEEPEALPPADGLEQTYSGTCGGKLKWSLDTGTGVLKITGSGDMDNYSSSSPSPWRQYSSSITKVELPSGLTSIGNYAFYFTYNLRSVEIPSTVTRIGTYAFEYCYALTSVTIPASVTFIGDLAFYSCSSLTAINVSSSNTSYASVDGVLYNKAKTTLIQCPGAKSGSVSIPGTVTAIHSWAFDSCGYLTGVTIPAGVTSIGDYAFSNCASLPVLTIPASVTEIGERAFVYCFSLKSIDVSSSNKAYSSRKGILYDKKQTTLIQCPCGKTGSVGIPDTVTTICGSAFEYCQYVTSVSIPASVTEIEAWAFDSCYSLAGINVASANKNFRSRDGILYDKAVTTLIKYPGGKAGPLAVPNGVERIENWAFYDCPGLTGVKFPASVSAIGVEALSQCAALTEIWFEGSAPEPEYDAFGSTTAAAYYPAGDPSWTEDVRQSYRGNITWKSYTGKPTFNPFGDVINGKYYYDSVLWAYYHDPQITSGISDTKFGPNNTCTRAQIVTFLWNAFGKPEPEGAENPFEDVEASKYYYKPVLWAVENGITNGVDETHFGPDRQCTRAQVVTFLWNAFDKPEPENAENPFEDVTEDAYYYNAVLWAVENGITSGVDETHFAPDKACTRGQVVTFLCRTSALPNN